MLRWGPTAEYLSTAVKGYEFKIVPLDLDEIGQAVRNEQVDFVLTNTGNYVELEASFGISRIATLKNLRQGRGYTQFGAVIFTRADHPRIRELSDLKGARFMGVRRDAFGGFQMAWRELLDHGVDPFSDLKELRFSGFPQDNIVYAVLAGDVDAGTVRTDTMERMEQEGKIDLAHFRVLNPRITKGFPFLHSTRLYPEWPFAKVKHTPDELAEKVAVALLNLPVDGTVARSARSAGWTIPLDYGPVHELFQTLKIGPYEHLGRLTFARLWREYRHWILLIIIATVLLISVTAWVLRVNRRIALKEHALREEVGERKRAQRLLAAHRDSLEQRVADRTRELKKVNEELEQDIAARRKAEEALRRSDATLRAMHDITVASAGLEAKVDELLRLGCSQFAMESGALTRVEDGNCFVMQAFPAQPESSGANRISRRDALCEVTLQHGGPLSIPDVPASQFRERLEDGEAVPGAYLGTPVTVDGHVYGVLHFASLTAHAEPFSQVDIDILLLAAQWIGGEVERIRAYERVQDHQSQLARVARHNTMGEMASGIAHELNQPLTAIINYSRGCLRRLREQQDGAEGLMTAIEKVSQEAERAGKIMKRLREFVSHGELVQERIGVQQILATVAELAGPELRRGGIQLAIDCPVDLPELLVDRIQIEQVVFNLIRNAIDALQAVPRDRRRIDVRARIAQPGYLQIEVRDNGPGIPPEKLGNIFDPFFTTKPDGMGLGLAISRSLVEAHRGKLHAHSRPGRGTIFECLLPLGRAETDSGQITRAAAAVQ